MAKKKPKSKNKPPARYKDKRKAGAWSGADARRAAAATSKPKGPRAQSLPGMSKVRDSKIDGFCEDAGEGLDQINAGTTAVNDAKTAALQRMRSKGMTSYVHAGVRFTRNEGVDSISVKRMKDKAASGSVSTQPSDAGEQEAVDEPMHGDDVDAGDGEAISGEVH